MMTVIRIDKIEHVLTEKELQKAVSLWVCSKGISVVIFV